MDLLRTPDARFASLPGWEFTPRYVDIDAGDGTPLRVHYVDEGRADAPPVLLLHGEPTWSYLYRKVIPVLVDAGLRAVAIDQVGFGRSDKPSRREDYTYAAHVRWMTAAIDAVGLDAVTLVGQDWGGLIGLRLVAAEPERFTAVVAANTFLPTGDRDPGPAFRAWQEYSQDVVELPVGRIVAGGCVNPMPDGVIAAYDAPFPEESFKAGARQFPTLVPTSPEDPESAPNRKAWEVLSAWGRPFLCAFSDQDPITRGGAEVFAKLVPGTEGQPHTTIEGAGHFLQEDAGEHLGAVIAAFVPR